MAKSYTYIFFLGIFLILTFRIFEFFPGMQLSREIWIVCGLLYVAVPYFLLKLINGLRISLFESYVVTLIIFTPLLGAITANAQFGQPIVYGLLGSRGVFLYVAALALYYYFQRDDITHFYIEKALIYLAWGTLALYCGIYLVFDPAVYLDQYPDFVSDGMADGDEFRFKTIPIVFGFFYYVFRGFRYRSGVDYCCSLIFLTYLVGVSGGRSLFVTVLIAFVFFIFRWGSFNRLIRLLPQSLFVLGLLLIMLTVFQGDFVTNFIDKLGDSFSVVITGKASGDSSADARISEFLLALPLILDNWLLGNGVVSNQWNGGYEGVLGGYFYPSDLGLIGAIFNYGVLGVIVFAYQFVFGVKFSKILDMSGLRSPLIDALKVMLLYIALHSVFTGMFVYRPEISLAFIGVLGGISLGARNRGYVRDRTFTNKRES